MAAGIPTSSPLLIQQFPEREVSGETGGIANRSSHLLSTQTSERNAAEAQSFITRIFAVVLGRMTWVWDWIMSLLDKAPPESSQEIPEKEVASHVMPIQNTDLTIEERVMAFADLLDSSYDLLEPWTETVRTQQIQMACNELPLDIKQALYQSLSLLMTDSLVIKSDNDLFEIHAAVLSLMKNFPVFNYIGV